jgi:hypothetical protein
VLVVTGAANIQSAGIVESAGLRISTGQASIAAGSSCKILWLPGVTSAEAWSSQTTSSDIWTVQTTSDEQWQSAA